MLLRARHHDRRLAVPAQRRREKRGELGVVEGNVGRGRTLLPALARLVERVDALLQREQTGVDVERLRQASSALVVLGPGDRAGRGYALVRQRLFQALRPPQVGEEETRSHLLPGLLVRLHEGHGEHGVRAR